VEHQFVLLNSDLHVVLLRPFQCLVLNDEVLWLWLSWTVLVSKDDSIILRIIVVFHLAILEGQFINNDGFSLIGELWLLFIYVLKLTMADDLAIWQQDFTRWHDLCLLDVQVRVGRHARLGL